jgi:ubiquinone/menaquinone biosynthesis C-methylase UbiE
VGFYQRRLLPWLIDRGMRNSAMSELRPRMPARATGRVLEIGAGSGLNLPHYTGAVRHLFALEPADALRESVAERADAAPFPVTLVGAGAEAIPLESASFDTVVTTWTLCSIPQVEQALLEMRRVLRPGGLLLFMEHGIAPDADVVRTQQRLAPVLRAVAGCNPDRPIDRLIDAAGFDLEEIERGYLEGPRFIAYHYVGAARPRT